MCAALHRCLSGVALMHGMGASRLIEVKAFTRGAARMRGAHRLAGCRPVVIPALTLCSPQRGEDALNASRTDPARSSGGNRDAPQEPPPHPDRLLRGGAN